jgi:FkbM family methyltransferase
MSLSTSEKAMATELSASTETLGSTSLTNWQRLWRCVREKRLPVRLKQLAPKIMSRLSGQTVIYCRNGHKRFLKFRVNDKSLAYPILDEIFNAQVYFPTINSRAKFEIKRGETVIDIGANVGLFAACAANLSRSGKVYCFEPSQDNFARLEYHRWHNGLDNMVLINKGVSDRAETTKLYLLDENCGAHSIVLNKGDGLRFAEDKYELIECISLQQVFDEYEIDRCHFLKLDCEGAEANILAALPAPYFKRIDRVALEYHANVDVLALAELLHGHGFEVTIKGYPEKWGLVFAIKH